MFRPLRQKKGQFELVGELLIQILLAFIILAAALAYSVSVASNLRVMKAVSARDVALLAEISEAAPGSIYFSYADGFGFKYTFGRNRVDVYLKDEDIAPKSLTFYLFPQDSVLKFLLPNAVIGPVDAEQQRTIVSLKKSFPNLEFGVGDTKTFSSSSCEWINVSQDKRVILILDISGDADLGRKIQGVFKPGLGSSALALYYNNEGAFQDDAKKPENENAVLVEISPASADSTVKIFSMNNAKAKRMACLVKNRLAQKNFASASLGTSAEDNPHFTHPVSLKFEVEKNPSQEEIRAMAEGIAEYFK